MFVPSPMRRPARFAVGNRVRKVRGIRSSAPIDLVFTITGVFEMLGPCPWAYRGVGEAESGVWEDELELANPTLLPRFIMGDRLVKVRHLWSTDVPVGTQFTVERVLDVLSDNCRWAYTGEGCIGGAWEDELAFSADQPEEQLAEWERELLSTLQGTSEVGTTNIPTKITLIRGQQVPIRVLGSDGVQRSYTSGRLSFDRHGEPFFTVQAQSYPSRGVS
jgi:hypothetical protein